MEKVESATDSQFLDETKDALTEEVGLWASNQKDALDKVTENKPGLNAHPPFVKAATWLSMGAQGTFTFFPRSALVASLESIAIPIAVVCIAVEFFKAEYENHAKKFNAMMLGNYTSLRGALKNKIDDVGRNFLNKDLNDFGRYVLATLRDVLKKRQKYLEEGEVQSYARGVLADQEFGIIESNNTTIEKRTAEGFESLANKMDTLYEGTELAWGPHKLIELDYSRTFTATPGVFPQPGSCPYDPKLDDVCCENVPFRITTLSGDHVTSNPRFGYYVENLWKLEVEKGPWMRQAPIPGADTVYVYASDKPDPRLEDVVTGIITKDKAKYPDIRKNIMAADEKLWARRMRM